MKKLIMFVSLWCLTLGGASANPKLLVVEWPFAKKSTSMTVLSTKSGSYPQGLVAKANGVRLPVYIPSAYVYQTNLQMVADSDFYSVTVPLSQAMVFIAGDRTYQQDSRTDGNASIRATGINFIRAEGMVSVDFNRHGVNYTLSIECDEPDRDQRCMQTGFLQQVYGDLLMVGGQP